MDEPELRTVMYHRILERNEGPVGNPSLVSASPAAFDRQMQHLARRYRVVSSEEVLAAFRSGASLPKHAVLITFDDAYRDFGDIAWPILQKYGLPATLFVASDYPDHPERSFWWDRLYRAIARTRAPSVRAGSLGLLPLDTAEARMASLRIIQGRMKRLPHADAMSLVDDVCRDLESDVESIASVLTWQELRSLAADGVTIGGHTRSHAALDRLPEQDVREEVRGCRADIARQLGTPPSLFAYPFGSLNDVAVEAVREAGFELAFGWLEDGGPIHSVDSLRLPRMNITPRTSPFVFRLRLLRIGSYVDTWRNARHRGRRHHATPE